MSLTVNPDPDPDPVPDPAPAPARADNEIFTRCRGRVLAVVLPSKVMKAAATAAAAARKLLTRPGPTIFFYIFLWLLTSLCAAVLSVLSFGFASSLDVCFMLSVYVRRLILVASGGTPLLACAAESCHKQISCRNKPEPGYICPDLRDSLLHMVITGDQEQSQAERAGG